MRLWTIQHPHAYEKLIDTGVLTANEDFLFCRDDFRFAYDWMSEKMLEKGIIPGSEIKYPIWAWYQWRGIRKRLDMRAAGYAERGKKFALLTVEIEDSNVLLSDVDAFGCCVMNYSYAPLNQNDDEEFEREYERRGVTWDDWRNENVQTNEVKYIREKVVKSWDRVFEIDIEDDGYLWGQNSEKSIQATFWQLKIDQVIKAEFFTAK